MNIGKLLAFLTSFIGWLDHATFDFTFISNNEPHIIYVSLLNILEIIFGVEVFAKLIDVITGIQTKVERGSE